MEWKPEEDLGRLGLAGIYRETFRVLRARRPFFVRMAAYLVLPLSALLLARVAFSLALFSRAASDAGSRLSRLTTDWAAFFLFEVACCLAILVLSLASTAISVFTVASFYCAESDHNAVAHVLRYVDVPEVCNGRLRTTLGAAVLILFGYSVVIGAASLALLLLPAPEESGPQLPVALLLGGAAHLGGMVYIGVVCHLAVVMSLLEDVEGFHAMRKSRALLAGRFWTAAAIFAKFDGCFLAVEMAFRALVVDDKTGHGVEFRVAAGLALVAVLCAVVVLALVAQAVVYFVCKSYHRESIDKAHLAYVGEYEPIADNGGVQMVQITGTATA